MACYDTFLSVSRQFLVSKASCAEDYKGETSGDKEVTLALLTLSILKNKCFDYGAH